MNSVFEKGLGLSPFSPETLAVTASPVTPNTVAVDAAIGDTGSVSAPTEDAGPAGCHLPDSWVLGIETAPGRVCFELEAVLERSHPAFYWPPHRGEQHAYAQIRWCITGEVEWLDGPLLDDPARDADGSVDYGNVDRAHLVDGVFHIEGGWGSVTVRGASHSVELLQRRGA